MDKKNYVAMLKDPRWQKKRLEIMQRDNFTCQCCGKSNVDLQVHHIRYLEGHNPWDYKATMLYSLCNKCHLLIHGLMAVDVCNYGTFYGDDCGYTTASLFFIDRINNKAYLFGVSQGSNNPDVYVEPYDRFEKKWEQLSKKAIWSDDYFRHCIKSAFLSVKSGNNPTIYGSPDFYTSEIKEMITSLSAFKCFFNDIISK